MAKIEKPAKAEKDIVKALKQAHDADKLELSTIDKTIKDAEDAYTKFLKDAEKQLQSLKMEIGIVTLRKKELATRVAKNADILGE